MRILRCDASLGTLATLGLTLTSSAVVLELEVTPPHRPRPHQVGSGLPTPNPSKLAQGLSLRLALGRCFVVGKRKDKGITRPWGKSVPTRERQTSVRIRKITGTCYSSLCGSEMSTKEPTFSRRRTEHLFHAGLFMEGVEINHQETLREKYCC